MKTIEKLLRVLANGNRLRIMKMLEKKSMCVCEITEVLGIRQPSVTEHLVKLKDSGLIGERQNGLYTEFHILRRSPAANIWKLLSPVMDNERQVSRDISVSMKTDRRKICK